MKTSERYHDFALQPRATMEPTAVETRTFQKMVANPKSRRATT